MRLATGVSSHVRSFVREPVSVVLLLGFPIVIVEIMRLAFASFPELPSMSAPPATVARMTGALFATAFLAGMVGVFQVVSATAADRRLVLCGFTRTELFFSRLVTLCGVTAVAALLSFGTLWRHVSPAKPAAAFAALVFAGVVFGLFGMLVGSLIPRELEGSLALVFLADADLFLGSGLVSTDSPFVKLFPLHYPQTLFESAVVSGTIATGDVLAGGLYAAVLLVLVSLAYGRTTGGAEA
ncbi:hypothetical protein V5735_02385 (plasmid) [Haladaptatus sp. SPP-AMP-3]|uniref:hypothetical protein n=1 Tax=Haladaptatus sp. SPP-AMP-3 TaxID=3121295 RepID=UPI003C2BF628